MRRVVVAVALAFLINGCKSEGPDSDSPATPSNPGVPDSKTHAAALIPAAKAPETTPTTTRSPDCEPLWTQAERFLDDNRNEEAIEVLNKAIICDPSQARFFNLRGVAALRLNRLRSAEEDFDRAIQFLPTSAKFHANRAIVHSDREKYDLALNDLNKAIELEPQAPEWFRERSLIHSLMGNENLAKSDLETSSRLKEGKLAKVAPAPVSDAAPILNPQDDARRKQELDRVQADVDAVRQELDQAVTPFEPKRQELLAAIKETEAHLEKVQKAKRTTAAVGRKLAGLQKELASLDSRIQTARLPHEKKLTDLEQQRRKVLERFPRDGDPTYVRFKDMLLTDDEFTVEKKKHPEIVAEDYIRLLLDKGILREATYVRTSRDILPFEGAGADSRLADYMNFHYQVQYVSKGGLLNERVGWVTVISPDGVLWLVSPGMVGFEVLGGLP